MWFLIKTKITYYEDDNIWHIQPDKESMSKGIPEFKLKMHPEKFRKLLFKLKAKDNLTSPRSVKKVTYKNIVDEIMSNEDNIVYFISSLYPRSKEDLNKLFLTIKSESMENIKEENIDFNQYVKKYHKSLKDVKNLYNQAIDLAIEVYGGNKNSVIKKYDKWIKETLIELLQEDKVNMKNLFIKFVESENMIDKFVEEVVSGDLPELDDTNGKEEPEVTEFGIPVEESVEDKEETIRLIISKLDDTLHDLIFILPDKKEEQEVAKLLKTKWDKLEKMYREFHPKYKGKAEKVRNDAFTKVLKQNNIKIDVSQEDAVDRFFYG